MGEFLHYLNVRKGHLLDLTIAHAQIVLSAIVIATAISLVTAILVYRRERLAAVVLSIVGTFLTIPSLALFSLLIPFLGLGTKPALVALVLYAMLPILRNTVVGLRSVDRAVLESARGMGMNRLRRLAR
ncbi:MAG: ABC transporter permease subunit, partial [Actinobacteria bacterium]|nr:ABC transporter permease subunit [Actinomycetota bacterium]